MAEPPSRLERFLHRTTGDPGANGHRERPPAVVDLAEFVREPDPDRDWVIPGLLERQGRILLAGDGGVGKSLLALTLAVQAAMGLTVLDRFRMDLPARTAYVDVEMGRSSIRKRVRALAISAKLEPGAAILCHHPDGIDLTTERGRKTLHQELGEFSREGLDLLVVDPLYKLAPGTLYEKDLKPALLALDGLRDRLGCALILIHHVRKRAPGEGRGSRDSSDVFGWAGLTWWPDVVLLLSEETLRIRKDRDDYFPQVRSWPVRRGGVWPIHLSDPVLDLRAEILDFVRQFGPVSGNEVAQEIPHRRNDVYAALKHLAGVEQIRRTGGGKWEAIG